MRSFTQPLPEITVFISSPSDVKAERQIVKQAIQEINSDPAWKTRCTLKPLAYEDMVPTQMGKPAQTVVNDFMRLSSQADLVVCILCNRMGTPAIDEKFQKQYLSGTHFEFDSAYRTYKESGHQAPRILLFLGSRQLPYEPTEEELRQYSLARNFKNNIKTGADYQGLFQEYRELSDLEKQVRIDLKRHLESILQGTPVPEDGEPGAVPSELPVYLSQLAENYRWLELQGIREAGTLRIELEKVYVALKAEPESEYDRQQAANLHKVEVQEAAGGSPIDVIDSERLQVIDDEIIRLTFRPQKEEARRARVKEVRTVADAFRQHRRIVILGGPGSGKSTLGRWLALQFARGLLEQIETGKPVNVKVNVSQVDPDPRGLRDPNEMIDLGPARLPIFLRISHFATELAERERQQLPALSIIDYLGFDADSCSLVAECAPSVRNSLFRAMVEANRAIIILDGLDELSEANRRTVGLKIQDFVEKYTAKNDAADVPPPFEGGGNQVMVTSRYVGYKLAPVRAGCFHFGIQSMQRPAVERFAYSWTEAVNAELAAENRQGVVAEKLIEEIYNEARPAVRELATNPLLVTILATVYWADGHLPDQRAGVYHRVVENLLRIWLHRQECRIHSLTREELLASLEPLAADMQVNASSNGLIGLSRISELVAGPLAHLRGMSPSDRRFRPVREALLGTIRNHVGLLAQQSPGNYAFFHRTFQEFLAARHLLADQETAAAKIAERLDEPLWREPLLLALGFAMIDPDWGPGARSRLLSEVLAADGPSALLPRAALMIVTALPDLRDAPTAIVGQTALQLLTSYALSLDQPQAYALREQIEQAFERLRQGRHASVVVRQLAELIRRQPGTLNLAGAAAALLRRLNWFTTELVESLVQVAHRDQANQDWPIRRALLAALAYRPLGCDWLGPSPNLSMGRLGLHLPMRRLLEAEPGLATWIQAETDWLWLLTALYGGLGQLGWMERLEETIQAKIRVAQNPFIENIKDEEGDTRIIGQYLTARPVAFSPHDIVHDLADAELSRELQTALSSRKPARDLIPLLQRKWNQGKEPAARAEALIGLAALGEDVIPQLRAALADPGRQAAAKAAIDRFGWLRSHLQEPLLRASDTLLRTVPDDVPEAHQFDLLAVAMETLIASGSPPLKVSDRIPGCRFVAAQSSGLKALLDAEYWSYLFSGVADEGNVKGSASPSQSLEWLGDPLNHLLESWLSVHRARNNQAANSLGWPQAIFPPRADTPEDRYLALLDCLANVPKASRFLAGKVLGRFRPFLESRPALRWETFALVWSLGESFWQGFRSPPPGCLLNELKLRFASVPETIIEKLRPLKDVEFACRHSFAAAAVPLVDSQEWSQYGDIILQQVSGEELASDDPNWRSIARFFDESERIADPYVRFRSEWRFLNFMMTVAEPNLGEEGNRDPLLGASRELEANFAPIVKEISDPHRIVLILERLLLTSRAISAEFAEQLVQNGMRIADVENRARALFRMASFVPEHGEQLFQDALECLENIKDLDRRIELIREVRTIWGKHPGMQQALDGIASRLPDSWLRDKALGRASRLVNQYREHYGAGVLVWRRADQAATSSPCFRRELPTGSLAWGLLYLTTTAIEAESLGASSKTGGSQWARLLGSERESAIADLVAASIGNGLPVGAREAAILDQVVQTGVSHLECLWPFLESPDPGAMATIARWSARTDRAGQWSALVQAEAGRLTPEIANAVIDILAGTSGRLCHRAALALHGPTPYTQNKNRRWTVRRVGAEAIEAIARRAVQPECKFAVRTTLNWFHSNLHNDDPKAIEQWLAQGASGTWRASSACWLLSYMQSIENEAVPPMLAALPGSPPELQRALLLGLSRLSYCCAGAFKDEKVQEQLRESVAQVPEEIRAGICVLGSGPVSLLKIVKSVLEAPGANRLALARQKLSEQLIWLRDSSRLSAVGAELFIPLETYWSNAGKEAKPLAEIPSAMSLLLDWLAEEHARPGAAKVIAHLLTAIEALASHSPHAFTVNAVPDFWEPLLTEWVQTGEHWTARMAAVRLVGRLRRVTDRVVVALSAAMKDVSFVQLAAYEAACEFRRVEGDILPDLLKLLEVSDHSVVAATARLLVGVAKSEGTLVDRRRILQSLEKSVAGSSLSHPVYLMDETKYGMEIRFVDRLDRILYRAIFEISGL